MPDDNWLGWDESICCNGLYEIQEVAAVVVVLGNVFDKIGKGDMLLVGVEARVLVPETDIVDGAKVALVEPVVIRNIIRVWLVSLSVVS